MDERNVVIWLNSIGVSDNTIDKLRSYFTDLTNIWSCNNNEILNLNNIKEDIKNRNDKYNLKLEEINTKIDLFEDKNKEIIDKIERMKKIKKTLSKSYTSKEELDNNIVDKFLKKIIVKENQQLEIVLDGDFKFVANKIADIYNYENVTDSR